ncbi:pleckstrin homology domain-containing family A member 8 isoform X1 [Pelobates cultripes]|uniref:Pleckstrin homology domain-containing family A member 8 n=2 Tax=Pelobates cultripes TaxID=61616 RepID=A0AAD1W462_PELCU|nr:pleckstrin homology domain-containing family A member 8 isoform X1 [Pelobates cultripes]
MTGEHGDSDMEGILYKWTNYLSGWQPRWFLLYGGILSYYDSKEDAWKGCKGSIQMAVCEIQVHPSDNTRMDLAIPGEQYFYLKARTAAERQQWLVALGSAKACITDFRTKKEKEFSDNTDVLKKKMSELRLYCDILVEQVTKTKETSAINFSESQENIDMGALLKSTCNTFLKTLEECMQIANTTLSSHLIHATPPGSPHLSVLKPSKVRRSTLSSQVSVQRKSELNNNLEIDTLKEKANHKPQTITESERMFGVDISKSIPVSTVCNEESISSVDSKDTPDLISTPSKDIVGNHLDSDTKTELHSVTDMVQQEKGEGDKEDEGGGDDQEGADDAIQTFFSVMTHRFSDIILDEDDGIPTQDFLDSCYAVVPVLDKLGSTVFAPVKMDFVGNIKKINQKYITNKAEFTTLQKIVLHEVNSNVAQVRNSATEALLWLKRGLKFLYAFLTELKNGENHIQTALSNAYGKTLSQYHGWVVRGVFALALRAAPSYNGFVAALTVKEGSGEFFDAMQRDLNIYLPAMEKHLCLLDSLYEEHGLESDEVV